MIIKNKYLPIFLALTINFIFVLLFKLFDYYAIWIFFIITFVLIPLIIRLIKWIKQKRETEISNKEFEVLMDINIKKDDKLKLIIFTIILTTLYYIFLKIREFDTFLFILLVLINIIQFSYNRKKITLSFKTDKLIELDNNLLNIKLKKNDIKKIEQKENWSIKIFTNEKELTLSIPYTSLVNERDKEIRSELMNEIIDKINNA